MDTSNAISRLYTYVEDVSVDRQTATIITPALCGFHGELVSLAKYSRYTLDCGDKKMKRYSQVFSEIVSAETAHFKLVAKLMHNLGADPLACVCQSLGDGGFSVVTKHVCTPEKMITDAITNEISSISEYEKIITRLNNNNVKRIIDGIILDERMHLEKLRELSSACRVEYFYR